MKNITRAIREERLSNGIHLIVDPFGASGVVSLACSFAGGKLMAGAPLVAEMTSSMLAEGTKRRSKREIQRLLDSLGLEREYGALGRRMEVLGKARTVHAEELFKLIAEELREPAFGKNEFDSLIRRAKGALQHEQQDTRLRAHIGLSRLLYAAGHPNRELSIEERFSALAQLQLKDVRAQARLIGTQGMTVVLSGNMPFARARALVRKYFGTLPPGAPLPELAPEAPRIEAEQALIPVPYKSSIDYVVGVRTGLTKQHRDFNALAMGLRILGNPGGFSGRLMQTVREKEGLTYGVYSYLKGFDELCDGHALLWGTFAPELFERGRSGVLRELRRIVEKGVSKNELQEHVHMLADGAYVRLSNTEARAQTLLATAHDGRPPSYLDEYLEEARALTVREVNAALKTYLPLQKLSEAAAGPVAGVSLRPYNRRT